MTANELRIGNLVSHTNRNGTFDLSINNINKIGAGLVYGDGDWFIQFKEMKLVPLTEEWLLKFGFEDNSYSLFFKKISECAWLVIDLRGEKFQIRENVTVDDHDMDIICEYVHQLQNLYFALTGQELEVKL